MSLKTEKVELLEARSTQTSCAQGCQNGECRQGNCSHRSDHRRSCSRRCTEPEERKVDKVGRRVAILNWPHDIGTVKAFSSARVVALEVVVQSERLSVLQVSTPSIPIRSLISGIRPRLGKLVSEVQAKAVAYVEVRIAALRLRTPSYYSAAQRSG